MDSAAGHEQYTEEQRQTMESGLRILARMIARAHLSRHQGLAPTEGHERNTADKVGGVGGTDHGDPV